MFRVPSGFSVAFLLTLSACVSSGTKVTAQQVAAFTPGKTTEAQVIASLGEPNYATVGPDGSKTDMYMHNSMHATAVSFVPIVGSLAGGIKSNNSMVTLNFDANGVLKNVSSSTGANDMHTGLLNQ